jgi:fibronectin type 3 domain-containing protein
MKRNTKSLKVGLLGLVCAFLLVLGLQFLPNETHAANQLSIDKVVTKNQTTSATSITTASFTTFQANELLVAFVMADGPSTSGGQTVTGITGGGLTWTLRQRANTQAGTSEIWQAVASSALTNVSVKANLSKSSVSSLTVTAFMGANTSVNGAVKATSASTGAPSVSLTATRNGSWVWGVGNDWDKAIARTVGANQSKVSEYLASAGDTMWVQSQATASSSSGSVATLNDTAPTTDRWNYAAIEILPAVVDTSPPSVPNGLAASPVSPTRVDLSWTASTDDVAVAGYDIYRDTNKIGTTTNASYSDITATANTSYTYTVRAFDAAGNVSADSSPANVTTPAPDTTSPTIANISANNITQTGVAINWVTDEASDSQVEYGISTSYGNSTTLNPSLVTNHSVNLTGLVASTDYHYRVKSKDASGNLAVSGDNVFTTANPVPDTTPPTVNLTAPANGATVSGQTVTVSASASDNVGVAGVQFLLDGNNLSGEDTSSPYAITWDTTVVANGTHMLSARARDAAGNVTTTTNTNVTVNNVSGSDPSVLGQWGSIIPLPAVAVHSALLPTGNVLFFQGDFAQGGQQYVFSPQTTVSTQVPNATADLFCAGQAVLADGRPLIVGGTSTQGGLGVRDITAFNWQNSTWQNLAQMHYPRWYATGTTLGDGKILVTSGANTSSTDLVQIPELYSPSANTWQDVTSATRNIPFYPFIYQLPDGRIVRLGASEEATVSEALNTSMNQWSSIDSRIIDGGSVTNYAPGKFMKAGSASDSGFTGQSAKTAYTLDMNQSGAIWQPSSNMNFARSFLNLTNLPDGNVLATGGSTDRQGYTDANGVLAAESWNPSTGQWTSLASMTEPRLYHSVALLLPDGRVYIAGGGGDAGVPDHKTAQIYSPPYLFKGPRPTISSAPGTVQYNSNVFVGTPNAASISRVSLIRTGSVTHAFDENTRALSLSFTQTAGGLNVQMPLNGNYAPPGYYMLSIVDSNGVPSVASFVRFPAPYEDNVEPSAPSSLQANGAIGSANLSWTGSSDNVGVTAYNVYRSTTPNFTASPINKIGQTTNTTFTDVSVPAGVYYYQVTAQDAVGNVSSASNEAQATVLADTDPPSPPNSLQATNVGGQSASLSWLAANDNVAVTGYKVYRDNAVVGTPAGTSFTDSTLQPNTTYSYKVTAVDGAGNESGPSNTINVTTTSVTLVVDAQVTTHQTSSGSSISVSGLTTTGPNDLLVAFISSDGPSASGSQTFSSVTTSGLTWTLRKRVNTQAGTSEIWTAPAPAKLTSASVTATRGGGSSVGSMTVVAFKGANTSVIGAVGGGSASTGAPSTSLISTATGSWVWAVGNDWDKAIARTVGANQTKVDEYLASAGDTFWVQRLNTMSGSAGQTITVNDTAPTADRWNFAAIEILPQ